MPVKMVTASMLMMAAGCSVTTGGSVIMGCSGQPATPAPKVVVVPTATTPKSASTADTAERSSRVVKNQLVLLRSTAQVHVAPTDDAEHSELFAFPATGRPALHQVMPARVVSQKGSYVAVATDRPEPTCGGGGTMFHSLSLTLWVHERDLVDVFHIPLDVLMGDGASVHLEPGLALGPESNGQRDVAIDGFFLNLAVPAGAIAKSYPVATVRTGPVDIEDATHMLTRDAALDLRNTASVTSARSTRSNGEAVVAVSVTGDETLIEYSTNCARFRAFVPSDGLASLSDLEGYGYGSGCGGYVYGRDMRVQGGRPIYWRNGELAGRVSAGGRSLHVEHSQMVAGRRCFKLHPTERITCGSRGRYLSLCFAPEHLRLLQPSE